jgi:hypothetical protein
MTALKNKFTFGIYENEDIENEAFMIAAEGIFSYREEKNVPLDKFLFIHLHNRLFNFKRDNFIRYETNCTQCKKIKTTCDKCEKRQALNKRKLNVLKPKSNLDNIELPGDDFCEQLASREHDAYLCELIEEVIPKDLFEDFLRLKDGQTINSKKKNDIIALAYSVLPDGEI